MAEVPIRPAAPELARDDTQRPPKRKLSVWGIVGRVLAGLLVVVLICCGVVAYQLKDLFLPVDHPSREELITTIKGMPRPAGAPLYTSRVEYDPGCEDPAGDCFTNWSGSWASMEIGLDGTPVENCLDVLKAFRQKKLRLMVVLDQYDLYTEEEVRSSSTDNFILNEGICRSGRVGTAYVLHDGDRLANSDGLMLSVTIPRTKRFETGEGPLSPDEARYKAEEVKESANNTERLRRSTPELPPHLAGVVDQPIVIASKPHLWSPDPYRSERYADVWTAHLSFPARSGKRSGGTVTVSATCEQAENDLTVKIYQSEGNGDLADRVEEFTCPTAGRQDRTVDVPYTEFYVDVSAVGYEGEPPGDYRVTIAPAKS